jgi:hypothetical protein
MFDLDTTSPPDQVPRLRTLLAGSISRRITMPGGADAVSLDPDNGSLARLDRLAIDVSGGHVTLPADPKALEAEMNGRLRPPVLKNPAHAQPGPFVTRFELRARPLLLESGNVSLPCEVGVSARDVPFVFGEGSHADHPTVMAPAGGEGEVTAGVDQEAFLAFARQQATLGAAEKGVTIDQLDLDVTSNDPRSLSLRGTLHGSKKIAFFNATFALDFAADVRVDDELIAHVDRLSLAGHGRVMDGLLSLLEPKLKQIRQTPVALRPVLGTLVPVGLGLHDLRIHVADGRIALFARFGAGGPADV